MRSNFKFYLGALISIASLTACVPFADSTDQRFSDSAAGLFSNRPENPDKFIGIVTLKVPPLLDSVKKNEKGDFELDQQALKALLTEQAQFEANLPKIAPSTKVIFKYRFVLNGYAVHGSYADMLKLKSLGLITDYEVESVFAKPSLVDRKSARAVLSKSARGWDKANSVRHIGAEAFHVKGLTGKGLKVGIIDTGIDYTHAMLGGEGKEGLYSQIDASKPSQYFPNRKVVGGIDLVGSHFAPGSFKWSERIPVTDENPIDELGHGTHVAGTVAGIGDGVETYSGVAPEAELFAIKVFGKGATSDYVVMAGFEYAVDPNSDLNINDRLDVVNLSLGGAFGGPKILYSDVIKRVVEKADMVVVSAAGNSGPIDYITGAPATTTEAISVAASIDDSFHNWHLPGIKIVISGSEPQNIIAPSADFGKSLDDSEIISGDLVNAGLANVAFPVELADRVKGKVALIQRGGQPFAVKAKHAEDAGAIGVVIYNDREGDPFRMGGEGSVKIPVVMIAQKVGLDLIKQIESGISVTVEFGLKNSVSTPEVIDTIAEFSSKGPRSDDLLIKPEIAAPGENIQSALMGGGVKGVQFSGTSMAAPHVAGAMALLKQAFPKLSVSQLKSVAMNTALPLQTLKKDRTAMVTLQGAGRIRLDQALNIKGIVEPSALSLGLVQLDQRKRIRSKVTYTNISDKDTTINVSLQSIYGQAVKLVSPAQFLAPAQKSLELNIDLEIVASELKNGQEVDGWIVFESHDTPALRIPFLMIPKKTSEIMVKSLKVFSDPTASHDAAVELELTNLSNQKGRVKVFNLLGKDDRKKDSTLSPYKSKNCDIQSVGYRIIQVEGVELLQIAVKLFNPVTHWSRCEVVALIDATGDGNFDQELGYITAMNVPGMILALGGNPLQTASILFNSAKVKILRKEALARLEELGTLMESYIAAVEDANFGYGDANSTVVILEARTAALQRQPDGKLSLKIASQDYSGLPVEFDDFFNPNGKDEWLTLSLASNDQGYKSLPSVIELEGRSLAKVELIKGAGDHELMVLMPDNEVNFSEVVKDKQQEIPRAKFW